MHTGSGQRGALFQVASQFNLLEMTGPAVSPEHGVSRYSSDMTQGPACAIAAGAGTIFRNYLVEVAGGLGQSEDRQIDCLGDLGVALGNGKGSLWSMRNGYALCTAEGLRRLNLSLGEATATRLDDLRSLLRIGLHWNVEATEANDPAQLVSQAYCSALPVAYGRTPPEHWRNFASLVLEAAYEATLLAGVLNARAGENRCVNLTFLGGGAFGNHSAWIFSAIARAVAKVDEYDLNIRLVCFGRIPDEVRAFAHSLNA